MRRYAPRILRLAIRVVGNEADAEDVLQEAFLKAYAKLEQFQGHSSFYTWIVRIAVNEALMRLRRRHGEREVSLDQEIDTGEDLLPREVEDWHPDPEQQFARQEMHGLSTEETAEALGLSIPAVKSRLLRARLQLREKLNRFFRREANPA